MWKHRYVIAALILAVGGCSSPTAPDTTVQFVRLQNEAFSGFTQPARLVIRDDAAWRDAWTTLWGFTTPSPALPAVDFDRDMVVIAATGSQQSSGYAVSIESVAERAGELSITVMAALRAGGCAGLAVITTPVDVVRVPRHDAVRFLERRQSRSCP
jgi:hypothetical protein